LQSIVDFGDVQVFEGVTTYPAILITQKAGRSNEAGIVCPCEVGEMSQSDKGVAPDAEPTPLSLRDIPSTAQGRTNTDHTFRFLKFETELNKELGKHFAASSQPMLQAALQLGGWQLEGDAASTLRSKLTAGRKTLKEVFGSPLRGVVTGLNEAFVLNRKERDDLIAAHPSCSGLLKPFLEGKDLKKWRVEPQDLWLIYIPKNKISIDDYPSIKAHLLPFKSKLEARATKQEWFELQQAQEAYQPAFEATKITYVDIADKPNFSLERSGAYLANTGYFIPNANEFLLALLSSKVAWHLLTGLSPAIRGGFHRLFTQYVETLPIPEASSAHKQELAKLAAEAQSAAEARRDVIQQFGRMVHRDFGKPPAGLVQSVPSFADFTAALKKTFKRELTLQEKNDWEATLDKARSSTVSHTNTIAAAEQAIDKIVYELFDLTQDEIAVVEGG
jgi:TaqI-like C-terminal specificity domain